MSIALAEPPVPQPVKFGGHAAAAGPNGSSRARQMRLAGILAAVWLGVAGLVVARLLVAGPAFDRLFAEDGTLFLADARVHGVASLWYQSAWYLHVVPRLLAIAGAQLPLHAYATYVVVSSALTVGALAAFVYVVAARVTRSPYWALLPPAGMALAPLLAVESLGTYANLDWWLIQAAFWAVLVSPAARLRLRLVATTVATLSVLSAPLTILVLPAALVHRRHALRHWPVWGVVAGAAVQALAIPLAPLSPEAGPNRHPGLHRALVSGLPKVLGPGSGPYVVVVLGAVLLAGVLVWCWRRSDPRGQRLGALTGAIGLAMFLVPSFTTGVTSGRYEAAATMFVISGLAMLAPALRRRQAIVALMILLAFALARFPASAYRLSGPSWSTVVNRFQADCRGKAAGTPADRAGSARSAGAAPVPVSPRGTHPALLRCPPE